MNYNILYKQILLIVSFLFFWTYAFAQENAIEEVFVTAEKRSESVQDISQAVTAISSDEIESKNITSFVDLSAIVPGVTVAKNEGYKCDCSTICCFSYGWYFYRISIFPANRFY